MWGTVRISGDCRRRLSVGIDSPEQSVDCQGNDRMIGLSLFSMLSSATLHEISFQTPINPSKYKFSACVDQVFDGHVGREFSDQPQVFLAQDS